MAKGCAIFGTATSYARVSSTLPTNGDFTIAGWFFIESRTVDTNENFFHADGSVVGLRLTSSNLLRLNGLGLDLDTSEVPQQGEWIYLALSSQNNGNAVTYQYTDFALPSTFTQQCADSRATAVTTAMTTLTVAANESGVSGWEGNIRVSQLRQWNVALTEAQVETEMASTTPVITSGLQHDFENDPSSSGNTGGAWTTNGTVTVSTAYFPPNYPTAVTKLKLLAHARRRNAA